MKELMSEFNQQLETFYSQYHNLDEKLTTIVLAEDKWSLNQIIGHLIDSASNNHQRFVRLQLKNSIQFPDYDKDEWLDIGNYNQCSFQQLFQLFYHYNKLLLHLIESVDKDSLQNQWETNWNSQSYITLSELMFHYVDHLKGHINHFTERLHEVSKSPQLK